MPPVPSRIPSWPCSPPWLTVAGPKAEGEAKGRADVVLKLLALKFGKLPAGTKKRVQHASLAELDRYATRVLKAKTLEDVFSKR